MADVKEDKTAAIVEVNSETDFVAKNAEFRDSLKQLLIRQSLLNQQIWMDSWLKLGTKTLLKTVQDALNEKKSL